MSKQTDFTASNSGKMYNDLLPIFIETRTKAVKMVKKYNALYAEDEPLRSKILSELFGSVGEDVFF